MEKEILKLSFSSPFVDLSGLSSNYTEMPSTFGMAITFYQQRLSDS